MFFLNIIQTLCFFFIFYIIFKQWRASQNPAGKAGIFGKSKAKMISDAENKVTFDDVAGVDEAREEVEEVVDFLCDPRKFQKLGGKIPRGVLFVGPPGTGKTLLARAIAGEAGVPFFTISGSDFVEMFVGVGASRVRDLFADAKKYAPCIVFIDEIDAVGRQRGAGLGGGHDEREQTLNQLLVEMDGFQPNDGVIIIAATNRIDVLDPALLRPGRFDRRVTVGRPDLKGRLAILKVHTKGKPLAPDVDLDVIARGTPGCTGAELGNLTNEAAIIAARRNKENISMIDFELAKDKIFMGAERKSMIMSKEEKWSTAIHECGHTITGKLIGHDPVHKVTIIPRGQALGLTWHLPTSDSYTVSKEQAESKIAVLLGGRIAEEIMFNSLTTGASNDIERATELAKKMVCEWGMSAKLGMRSFGKKDEPVFMGRGLSGGSDYSEKTSQQIDEEISSIIDGQYRRVYDLLMRHKNQLVSLGEALMDRETLDAEEIDSVMNGMPLPVREKVIIPTYKDVPRKKVIFVSPEQFGQLNAQRQKEIEKLKKKKAKETKK